MKMKFPKRMLACLVSLCMLMTLLPATAFAEETIETEQTLEGGVETQVGETDPTDLNETNQDNTGNPEEGATVMPLEDSIALPESEHDYASNCDQTWSYTADNAPNGVYVTFAGETKVESGYDFIYVMDGNGNQIGKYTGTELSSATVYVPTATVKIRLTSDSGTNAYGFKVTSIVACGEKIDLEKVAVVNDIPPVFVNETPSIVVKVNGTELVKNTDYTVVYDTSEVGLKTATITGNGKYSGTMNVEFSVVDEENLLAGAAVKENVNINLRHTGDGATTYITFDGVTDAWVSSVESITLTPIEKDGTVTEDKNNYPNGPKAVTLSAEELTVNGNKICFKRTAENPVVYVRENHEPVEIKGGWSTVTYPQSQIYKVTVKAHGYKDTEGTTTYYTGTSPDFSIIIDADGDAKTTDDQEVVKSWTSEEIAEKAVFANGSSQCGMTGFRTFSGMGVSLKDLLAEAGVEVSESDSFLLDTSDHYGNKFTYAQLFGTTRYFLDCIYEDDFADFYDSLISDGADEEAGSTIALRRYLAEQCLKNPTTIDARINTNYDETLVSTNSLKDAVLPTKDNTQYNSLVSYENQFRFFYGIALVQEECTVNFDSQGGSEVAPQTVLSHMMTSTENTTIKSSYWANSLVIYRGAGKASTPSTAAKSIVAPKEPTREGYVFAGWYTDADCTEGNKFDFNANDGTVDQSTTLYAKWIPEEEAITVTDFDITNVEHNDADKELNQTIIATITFDSDIKLTAEDLSDDLLITIAGGDVNSTKRKISYEVKNGNQLVITMVSNDWVAIYNGKMAIEETAAGVAHIVAADGSNKKVIVNRLEEQIPIGIVVTNDSVAGTETTPAKTYAAVTHKANMRGMYFFQFVSIVDGQETVIGTSISHAHNFYTTVDEAAIASAMAAAINKYDGYTTTYNEGDTFFVITAEHAVAGETLAVRMKECNAEIHYAHVPAESVIENKINATTQKEGSYDSVVYCSFCGKELSRETVKVPTLDKTDADKVPTPDKTDSGKVPTPDKTDSGKVPTGDHAPIALYVVLLAVAGAVVVLTFRRKRTNR